MKFKLLVLLLSVFLLAGCGMQNPTETSSDVENSTENTDAPESTGSAEDVYKLTFEATTIGGETMTSDIFTSSKLTMINVWATYCNPCLSEMPDLGEIAASYDPEQFQILGIISDVSETSSEKEIENALNLISETNANYPHLLLNESLYQNLVGGINSVPMTFFVTEESEVLGYVIGARDKESWVKIIDELLEQQ